MSSMRTFLMSLDEIQPSQLFISSEKLAEVTNSFDQESIDPIPVIRLGEQIVFTDGHTRALAAFLNGLLEVPVYWDEDDLDLETYAICVDWCEEEGIRTIADLKDRLLPPDKYQLLWIDRCTAMLRQLEHSRGHRDCDR